MKGNHLIQSVVLLEAWERWRIGYSKIYNPDVGKVPVVICSWSVVGKKRKYTFSLLRQAQEDEIPTVGE